METSGFARSEVYTTAVVVVVGAVVSAEVVCVDVVVVTGLAVVVVAVVPDPGTVNSTNVYSDAVSSSPLLSCARTRT